MIYKPVQLEPLENSYGKFKVRMGEMKTKRGNKVYDKGTYEYLNRESTLPDFPAIFDSRYLCSNIGVMPEVKHIEFGDEVKFKLDDRKDIFAKK